MKFKISLSTYNLDIIEAFSVLRNKKSQFVEQALLNFIGTKKGKDTIKFMLESTKVIYKIDNARVEKKILPENMKETKEELGRISVDNFLK